jgi:hypothetical protein
MGDAKDQSFGDKQRTPLPSGNLKGTAGGIGKVLPQKAFP